MLLVVHWKLTKFYKIAIPAFGVCFLKNHRRGFSSETDSSWLAKHDWGGACICCGLANGQAQSFPFFGSFTNGYHICEYPIVEHRSPHVTTLITNPRFAGWCHKQSAWSFSTSLPRTNTKNPPHFVSPSSRSACATCAWPSVASSPARRLSASKRGRATEPWSGEPKSREQ